MKQVIPETAPDFAEASVIERPDGFYWAPKKGGREYGPFQTLREAMQDMQTFDEEELEPGETLEEAEAEIGVSEWVDPESGDLADVPHLADE